VLTAVAAGPVDVVLMDLRMPVMDGIEATRRLGEEYPEVAVVVLTTFADDDSILGALSAGARGYLAKNAGRQDITRAIRAAAAGQSVLDREVQDRLLATVRTKAPVPGQALPEDLTPRLPASACGPHQRAPPPPTQRPSRPFPFPRPNGCGHRQRTICRRSARSPPSPSAPATSGRSTSTGRTGTTSTRPGRTPTAPAEPTLRG
jgi:chemotaxis response regulator CheB